MTLHHPTLKTALGLVLAAGAIAPTAASAELHRGQASPRGQRLRVESCAAVRRGSGGPRRHVRTSGGFDWGDAMIGAAGGVGLSMLGLATALGATSRRSRRWSKPADVTS